MTGLYETVAGKADVAYGKERLLIPGNLLSTCT